MKLAYSATDGSHVGFVILDIRSFSAQTYTSGGLVVDLRDKFSTIGFADVTLESLGQLNTGTMEVQRDQPTSGQLRVKLFALAIGTGVKVEVAQGTNISQTVFRLLVVGDPLAG